MGFIEIFCENNKHSHESKLKQTQIIQFNFCYKIIFSQWIYFKHLVRFMVNASLITNRSKSSTHDFMLCLWPGMKKPCERLRVYVFQFKSIITTCRERKKNEKESDYMLWIVIEIGTMRCLSISFVCWDSHYYGKATTATAWRISSSTIQNYSHRLNLLIDKQFVYNQQIFKRYKKYLNTAEKHM